MGTDPEELHYYSFLSGRPMFRDRHAGKCYEFQNRGCVTVMENCMRLINKVKRQEFVTIEAPKKTQSVKRSKLAKGRGRRDAFAIRRTQTESGGGEIRKLHAAAAAVMPPSLCSIAMHPATLIE